MTGKREYHARAPQVRVHVTDEIIEQSEVANSSHCMLADAVVASAKAMGFNPKYPSVDLQTIRWSDPDNGYRYTYLTPRSAQVALINFDQGRHTEPFTFRLTGGQVTKSGAQGKDRPGGYLQPPTDAKVASARENVKSTPTHAHLPGAPQVGGHARGTEDLSRPVLVTTEAGSGRTIPVRNGGATPPTTPFSKRRQYGLRALER